MSDRSPAFLQLQSCTVDLRRAVVDRDGAHLPLTPRELALLRWFATHPGRAFTRQELLKEIWGYRGGAKTRAVDVAVRRLREKIEATPSAPEHLLTARGAGYRFEVDVVLAGTDTNLSPERDRFFGREDELTELGVIVARAPLSPVTLVGPPGIGKTRLARRFAAREHATTPPEGGVWFVDCADAADPDALLAVVARAAEIEGDTAAALGDALAARGATLVVLDNVEQITGPAGALVEAWLAHPEIAVVSTTREPLRLRGERLLRVPPLPRTDARQLFLDRAASVRPDALKTPRDLSAADEIITLMDGLPLAIELAAAQLGAIPPSELQARLARGDALAMVDPRPDATRHHSLRRAIQTSWALLTAHQRDALTQLSVFKGSFTADAAEAVVALPSDAPPTWSLLSELERRSLLQASSGRLRLLRYIRAFAAEHLTDSAQATIRRHGAWFIGLGPTLVDADIEDLLTATEQAWIRGDRTLASAGQRALEALALPGAHPRELDRRLFESLGHRIRGALDRAAEASAAAVAQAGSDPGLRSQALRTQGWLQHLRGDLAGSVALLEAAAEAARSVNNRLLLGTLRTDLGACQMDLGEPHVGMATLLAARADLRVAGNPPSEVARCLSILGCAAMTAGELDEAEAWLVECRQMVESTGERVGLAWCLNNLGEVARMRGALDVAAERYEAAAALFEQYGSGDSFVASANLALVQIARGEFAAAREVLAETLQTVTAQGRRARMGVVHAALLPCAAHAGDADAFDTHLAAATQLLTETGFRDRDIADLCRRAADVAPETWTHRATAARALAKTVS